MKNSPRPLFLLHQTLELALCIGAASVLLASAKHRFFCRTARWWSVIQRSRFHCSRVQWRRALRHSSQRLVLHMVIFGLCAAGRPWKLISWSSRQTVIVVMLLLDFHFTITALTVDWGSSSRVEILRTDMLERWHALTVPLWKSLCSSVRPFYCQCLSMVIAWLCGRFYTPVSNGCGWNCPNPLIWRGVHILFYIYSVFSYIAC